MAVELESVYHLEARELKGRLTAAWTVLQLTQDIYQATRAMPHPPQVEPDPLYRALRMHNDDFAESSGEVDINTGCGAVALSVVIDPENLPSELFGRTASLADDMLAVIVHQAQALGLENHLHTNLDDFTEHLAAEGSRGGLLFTVNNHGTQHVIGVTPSGVRSERGLPTGYYSADTAKSRFTYEHEGEDKVFELSAGLHSIRGDVVALALGSPAQVILGITMGQPEKALDGYDYLSSYLQNL